MNHASLLFAAITFALLGSVSLGLVAGLANMVTNEYVDRNLPGNPIVQEYEFRIPGRYGLVSLFLLIVGSALVIGGNAIGICALCERFPPKRHSGDEKDKGCGKPVAQLLTMCVQCGKKLPINSKFCPKCGSDLKLEKDYIDDATTRRHDSSFSVFPKERTSIARLGMSERLRRKRIATVE